MNFIKYKFETFIFCIKKKNKKKKLENLSAAKMRFLPTYFIEY